MQPVNDDMDNLFRRAAEGYPLHTHGANFDKVRQQMDTENSLPEKEKKSRKYLWLLLLLLIPLPFLYQHYQSPLSSGKDKQYTIAAKQEIHNQDNSSTDNASPHKNNGSETTGVTGEEIEKEKNNTTTAQPVAETPAINTAKEVSNAAPGKAVATVEKQNIVNNVRRRQNRNRNHSSGASQPTKNNKQQQGNENFFSSAYTKKRTAESDLLNKRKDAKDSSGKLLNAVPAVATQTPNVATTNTVNDSLPKIKAAKQITDTTTLTKINKHSNSNEDTTASKSIAAKDKNRKKPSVYIGIAIGPDYSTVKSNKSNGPGYNVGFIAGYQTGKHLAFETGMLWNYKKYYSDGKHVSLDKLALLSHTEVIYLDGTCGMIEIPVSIRYHFNSKGKSNWYAGTGVSSYIMKKEDYYYKYKRYNMDYYSEKEYINSSKNWFSVLQFNVGYQLNLNKWGSLRMEPYVKLPMHGIGIGNLPLSGGGINIGYTLPVR